MSVTISEAAARHVTKYLSRRGKGVGVRLGVKTTGCSGLAYKLEYADEIAPEDVVFEDKSPDDDGFDADAAIATGELIALLPDLFAILGGEQEFGAATPAVQAPLHLHVASGVAATETATVAEATADDTPPWED